MGIILKQSAWNTAITFVGFGIGAVNALFLYTYFLSDQDYGLVMVILSTGAILMPLMALGMHNTLLRFYEGYQEEGEKDRFLSYSLLLPVIPAAIVAALIGFFPAPFQLWLGQRNAEVGDFLWHIYFTGLGMAYFEIFYAYSKVQLKSIWGTGLKEIFPRFGVLVLLLLFHYSVLDIRGFFYGLVGVYLGRATLMKWYAYRLRWPKIHFKGPKNHRAVLSYSALILLGGSASVILLEIDKFMLNQYLDLSKVAYYGVGVFIATVIIVPVRAMSHITFPLTAKALHEDDKGELKILYTKTSINLLAASLLLFLLIVCSLDDLYLLLPEGYGLGWWVVFLIGVIKVMEASMGNVNSILFYSKYYKGMLLLGIFLAVLTIGLNILFIPQWGAIGAAWATFSAVIIYNLCKLLFVWKVFGLFPWTSKTALLLCFGSLMGLLFLWLPLGFSGIPAIVLRSLLLAVLYGLGLYYFAFSEDIKQLMDRYIKRG